MMTASSASSNSTSHAESTAAQTRDGVKRHHQISDVGVACCLESRSIKEFEKD